MGKRKSWEPWKQMDHFFRDDMDELIKFALQGGTTRCYIVGVLIGAALKHTNVVCVGDKAKVRDMMVDVMNAGLRELR